MSWTKRVTTVEEYDATGKLTRKTVTTEETGYSYPTVTPCKPWYVSPATWYVGGGFVSNTGITSGFININDDEEPDDGVGVKA